MSRYEIKQDSLGDWDLLDERGAAVAYWSQLTNSIIVPIVSPVYTDSIRSVAGKTCAEARGLMLLNMIKQQLEAEDEKTDSV